MNFGDAFSKIFGTAPQQNQQPQPNQGNPNQQPQQNPTNNPNQNPPPQTQQSTKTDANGLVPKDANASPLAEFKDLWKTTPIDPNAPQPVNLEIDPKKLVEAAGKVDFSKILDPAVLAKIQGGGEEATTALISLLNKTAQATYGQAMIASNQMVAEAVKTAKNEFQEAIPHLVKRQNAQEGLFANNPAFKNPVVEPVVKAIQTQLTEKYPNASAAELNQMAIQVLQGTADLVTGTKKVPEASNPSGLPNGKVDEDWSLYLTS